MVFTPFLQFKYRYINYQFLDWGNPMTYRILDWKIYNASRELKQSNTTPQVRSYVFSIQDSVSHRIGNPVWIYNRSKHFFHSKISSHYVLDNTIWLLLSNSHTGLVNSQQPLLWIKEMETWESLIFVYFDTYDIFSCP